MKKIYFFKYSYGVICFCICFLNFHSQSFAQNTPVAGDFRSINTGNWNDYTTWQIFDGVAWQTTTSDQIPNQNSAVFLEENKTVTLQQNGECKNLFLNDAEDVARLNTQSFELSVYGKLALYSGSVTDLGGIASPQGALASDLTNPLKLILTDINGRVILKGVSRVMIAGGEFNLNLRLAGWTLEISLNDDAVGIVNQNFRVGELIVSSGTLDINDASRVFIDMTGIKTEVNGTVLIKSGATVVGGRLFTKANEAAIENFTIEEGGAFYVRYTAHTLAAKNLNLKGTYGLIGNINQHFSKPNADGFNRIGASRITSFSNLEIDLSGQKVLQNDIVVNDTLFMKGNAELNLNGFGISYGLGGSLEYAGSSTQLTSNVEFPGVDGPSNLIINNSNHVSLHLTRAIEGDLTLKVGRFLLGNNNFTIGENSIAVGGTLSADNMVLLNGTGILQRGFFQPSKFLFPVGEINTGVPVYAPITINLTQGDFGADAVMGVTVTNEKNPYDNSSEDYLARYWTIIGSDITAFEYGIEADYLDHDVNGQEEDISAFLYNAGVPNILSSLDITSNKIRSNNITLFGDITGSNLCDIANNTFISVPATTEFCQETPNLSVNGSTASGSGVISYSWELRVDEGLWNPVSGEVLEDITLVPQSMAGNYDLRRITTSDICSYPSISQYFSFTILPEISGNHIMNDGASSVCEGTAPGLFIGDIPEGGINAYSYGWQQRIDGGDWETVGEDVKDYQGGILAKAGTYEYRRLISSGACATPSESNVITLTVDPALGNNTISTEITSFCGNTAAFTIVGSLPTGGNDIYSYSWERRFNGGTWENVGVNETDFNEEVLTTVGNYEYRRLVASGSCDSSESNILTIILRDEIEINGIVTDALGTNSDGSIVVEVAGGSGPYDFNWSSGATTQNIENIAAGSYTLTVIDNNGCEFSKAFTVAQLTGFEEEKNVSKFSVYPNPVSNKELTIDVQLEKPSSASISLFNTLGVLVLERHYTESKVIKAIVDIQLLPDGFYYVELAVNSHRSSKKIVKSSN